jgi:hypothetical protein
MNGGWRQKFRISATSGHGLIWFMSTGNLAGALVWPGAVQFVVVGVVFPEAIGTAVAATE